MQQSILINQFVVLLLLIMHVISLYCDATPFL